MSQKAVKHLRCHLSRQSQLLVIAGLLILAVIILLMKQETKVKPVAAAQLPRRNCSAPWRRDSPRWRSSIRSTASLARR
jgi:hypothetical protein